MLLENYPCISKIADGTHSTIYLTKIPESSKSAIAKVANKDEPEIQNEVEMLTSLHHDGIISLVDNFEKNSQRVLVFEQGKDLFQTIIDNGPFSETNAKSEFRTIFEAIRYIHSNKIIHRDIKLDNIIQTKNHQLKLIDFGLACQLKSKNICNYSEKCGTEQYLAPELLTNMPYDFEIDIWSLGITLYAAITASFPFDCEDSFTFTNSVLSDEPDFDECYDNEGNQIIISSNLQSLLRGMLQKDPKKRFTINDCLNHPWFTDPLERAPTSN